MRNPSIHLTKSNLFKVLEDIGYDREDAEYLTNEIVKKSASFSIKNRVAVFAGRKEVRTKIAKTVASTVSEVELFNRVLDLTRKLHKHNYIRQILKTDKDYNTLKEIAIIAEDFCSLFEYSNKEQGFRDFCELGIKMMGKRYALNKFKYYKSHIFDLKESVIVIENDDNAKATQEVHDIYKKMMLVYGNLEVDLLKPFNPEKYKNIVFARQEADDNKAKYKDWIKAQFEGLAFLNAVPELSQLHGEKAKERYERNFTKENKPEIVDETKIVEYKSESEAKYWEMVRKKAKK